jgi:FlaG/FlaF family flagellin (archaellin)
MISQNGWRIAITVILAAVIASFVLGLGDSAAEPSPSPTIDASLDNDTLTLDVTGGDDFSASDATIQGTINGSDQFEFDMGNADIEEVTAGTSIVFNNTAGGSGLNVTVDGVSIGDTTSGTRGTIEDWEVQIIWNPADQDSDTIYSDSNN